jgi:23S rRNA (pseudouridine1915-N3)-methyltransferase
VSFSIDIVAFCRKGDPLDEEIERYCRLCRPYARVAVTYLKSPGGSSYPKHELLEVEAKMAQARIHQNSMCVALSEEGKSFRGSASFAQWLSGKMTGGRAITFVLGGAFGLSPRFKQSCTEVISLSPLTFAHKLALAVLLEQVYRAFTILRNHPYHK